MATVIGFDKTKVKTFTCHECTAIVEYTENEVIKTDQTDEGTRIYGLYCPNCRHWHRTNY
jgi:RNase P subunit RPR2